MPAFCSLTALGDVHRDGADLRVRHQAARTEHLTEAADDAHHVGGRDHLVEVHEAALDLLGQVLGADDVGAGLLASRALSPLANTATLHGLAHAVRQHDGAADHLVGVLRVHAEVDRRVHRLVELLRGGLPHEPHRLVDAYRFIRSTFSRAALYFFAVCAMS